VREKEEKEVATPDLDRQLGSLAIASSESFDPLAKENRGYAEAIVRLFPNPEIEKHEPSNPIARLVRKIVPLNEGQIEETQRRNVLGMLETTDGRSFNALYIYFNNELLDGFSGKVEEMAKREERSYPEVAEDLYQLREGLTQGDMLLRERLFVEYVEALSTMYDISGMTKDRFLREFMKWKHPELSLPQKQAELRREGRVISARADSIGTALDPRNGLDRPRFGQVLDVIQDARGFRDKRYILDMATQGTAEELMPRLKLYGLDRYCGDIDLVNQRSYKPAGTKYSNSFT